MNNFQNINNNYINELITKTFIGLN